MNTEQQADKVNKILMLKFGEILNYNKETLSSITAFYQLLAQIRDKKYIDIVRRFIDNKEDYNILKSLTKCNNFEQVFMVLGGYTDDNFKLIDTL